MPVSLPFVRSRLYCKFICSSLNYFCTRLERPCEHVKPEENSQSDQKTGTTPAPTTTPTAERNSRIDKFVFSGKEESKRKNKKVKRKRKIRREIIIKISWMISFLHSYVERFLNDCSEYKHTQERVSWDQFMTTTVLKSFSKTSLKSA